MFRWAQLLGVLVVTLSMAVLAGGYVVDQTATAAGSTVMVTEDHHHTRFAPRADHTINDSDRTGPIWLPARWEARAGWPEPHHRALWLRSQRDRGPPPLPDR